MCPFYQLFPQNTSPYLRKIMGITAQFGKQNWRKSSAEARGATYGSFSARPSCRAASSRAGNVTGANGSTPSASAQSAALSSKK